MTERIELRLGPDERAESPYLEVPFEVPAGVGAIHVRLAYAAGREAVIDLGCSGPQGWRGWSGGARSRFTITADAATPGYVPGEPEPGVWSVVLGLHRVPGAGVGVVVEIELDGAAPLDPEPPEPPVPQRPPRRALPAEPGLTWLACDFHAHTLHSDGTLGIGELAATAVSAGLDVLAVTDHNTVSHHAALPRVSDRYGVGLLPGQEVTTDRGHANAFGAIDWVDFRRPAAHWVRDVDAAGGLLSINHPLAADCSWHQPLEANDRPPLAEIWHWSWLDRTWTGPLAWWEAWNPSTVPISGSDFHSPAHGRPLAQPVTWVACESAAPEDVLDGLRQGRTAVTAGTSEPVLLRVDDELVAVDADGLVLADTAGRRQVVHGDMVRFPGAPGPHRLETPLAAVVALTR